MRRFACRDDAYVAKSVLHDWNDEECIRIFGNMRRAAAAKARLFLADFVVPGPEEPHFSKLFDIHMMCRGTGRERTAAEYAGLMAKGSWRYDAWHRMPNAFLSLVAATGA